MKKLFILSCSMLYVSAVFAAVDIPPEKIYGFTVDNIVDTIPDFIENSDKQKAVAEKYTKLMDPETGMISAVDFVDLCIAGGINAKRPEGYAQCLAFFNKLLDNAETEMSDGGFNMFCPASDNGLKSITDTTMVGDFCSSTNINTGLVTLKKTKGEYKCTCMAIACNDGYRFKGGACVTDWADTDGNCKRYEIPFTINNPHYNEKNNTVLQSEHRKRSMEGLNDIAISINAFSITVSKCQFFANTHSCKLLSTQTKGGLIDSTAQILSLTAVCNPNQYEFSSLQAQLQARNNRRTQEELKELREKEESLRKKRANLKFYRVCDDDAGKTGGTERCVKGVFEDIEVNYAMAHDLAHEYALVKYGDDIYCSPDIYKGPLDDYVKCTSLNNNVYYEFIFDDAKESNAYENGFVNSQYGNALCIIYGGEPKNVRSKASLNNKSGEQKSYGTSECKHPNGNALVGPLQKKGYKALLLSDGVYVVAPVNSKYWDTFFGKILNESNINKSEPVETSSQNYYAKFNGKTFTVYRTNGTSETMIRQWNAVSGRGKKSDDPNPTICQLPQYQRCEDVGPTPAGVYYINKNNIEYSDNITFGNFTNNKPWVSNESNLQSWGRYRVKLNPASGTNTFGRHNMYVHGGRVPGSSGCIDLTDNIGSFIEWLQQETGFVELKIIVDYGYTGTMCINCNNTTCTPCKCPSKDEAETACDYR